MNWLADINVQGLRGNIVGKTWQDVGGKPSLDKARDKKATNYRFDQRCASQSQINSCPKKLGNKSGMLARDQVSSVWQGSIYLNSVAFFNTNVNTDTGFLMEIKPSCRLFSVNQGTHLCQNRDLLMILKWGDFISASAGSSAWMLATLLNKDFSELGIKLYFSLVSPQSK